MTKRAHFYNDYPEMFCIMGISAFFVSVGEIQQVSLWGLNKDYFTNRDKFVWEMRCRI